ncbi:MAG: arabinose efflux permease family protein, partial [Mycobacterium sp.]|nr:arabinose efflux permease family protein [Mycobacterium sp.]
AFDTDLALAGFGLGLVIGPLTSAALRVVPSAEHGIASAAVVVSRMIGMLIGMAALSAWGLYRFNQILQSLPVVDTGNLLDAGRQLLENTRIAYTMQYGEIFAITAVVCVVGALASLLISDRNHHDDQVDEQDDGARTPAKDQDSSAFPTPPSS